MVCADIQDWNGASHVESDVSDEVFEQQTSEARREDLRERRKNQKKEKPVKLRPYSEQVDEIKLDFLQKWKYIYIWIEKNWEMDKDRERERERERERKGGRREVCKTENDSWRKSRDSRKSMWRWIKISSHRKFVLQDFPQFISRTFAYLEYRCIRAHASYNRLLGNDFSRSTCM